MSTTLVTVEISNIATFSQFEDFIFSGTDLFAASGDTCVNASLLRTVFKYFFLV